MEGQRKEKFPKEGRRRKGGRNKQANSLTVSLLMLKFLISFVNLFQNDSEFIKHIQYVEVLGSPSHKPNHFTSILTNRTV